MAQRKRAQRRAPGRTYRKGTPQRRDGYRPTSSPHRATPEAHAHLDAPPQHGSDAAGTAPARAHRPPDPAQGKEGTPTRGEGATPTRWAAENTAGQPTTTPPPPRDDPCDRKGNHTGNGTGTGGDEDTAATPRTGDGKEAEGQDRRGPNAPEEATTPHPTEPDTPLGAMTPRGHVTKPQAPSEVNPADADLKNGPPGSP